MKIRLIWTGKTADAYLDKGIAIYQSRLKHYCRFDIQTLPDIKNAKSLSKEELKEREGKQLLDALAPQDILVLLDETGKTYTSPQLADFVQKLLNRGGTIVFVIGGAYGFSQEVYNRADTKLSLSPLTFSHQMVRLIFAEQLYRAFTIMKGEPYHHG
ncbi:MAG TPA: 23S rRNA (pseudouridine(1915)-N(3))-methyltransferase RlmH [Bacteroidia bacterium]|nr:23S rRNA (pseudouridine(1915)-N(3))-methyltransferase RlmH [Bacteroidia bacterium]